MKRHADDRLRNFLAFLLTAGLTLVGPGMATASLIGGNGDEDLGDHAIGPDGRTAMVLTSSSTDWTQPGGTSPGGGDDLVLILLDGGNPTHTLYYGGSGDERAHAVSVAEDGTIWVAGSTTSDDLALMNPLAEGGACTGCGLEGFVARFSADGATLLFATYLGGRADGNADEVLDLAILPDGVAVVGRTASSAFPVRGGPLQATHGNDVGANDGFFAHLVVEGDSVTLGYSTFLGGNRDDVLGALAVGPDGRIYFGGSTESDTATFSLTRAFDDTASAREGLVYALDPVSGGGYEVAWSSFLGGLSDDSVFDLAPLADGLVVVGESDSSNFAPNTQATLSSTPTAIDAFLVRLLDTGDRATLAWWTFAGGQGDDRFEAVGTFPDGQIVAAGFTASADLLPVDPSVGNLSGLDGVADSLVSVYAADGLSLLWSELAGGAGVEQAASVTATAEPRFIVTLGGDTDSTDFLSAQGRTPLGTNTFTLSRALYDDAIDPIITELTATFSSEGGDRYGVEASWTASDAQTGVVSTLWSVEPVEDLVVATAHGPVEVGTLSEVSQSGITLEPGVAYAVKLVVRDASGLTADGISESFTVPGGPDPDGGMGDGGGSDGGEDEVLEPVFGWSCSSVERVGGGAALLVFLLALASRRRTEQGGPDPSAR